MVSTSYRSVFPPRRAIGGFWGASDINRRIRPARFTVWTLGFNQFRFHHAIRVLAVLRLDGFVAFDLSEHAVVPYAFRFQVSSVTQEFNALLLLCYTGINCVVTRHTMDVRLATMAMLARQVLEANDQKLLTTDGARPSDWIGHLRCAGALLASRPGESLRAAATQAGRFLSAVVNRPLSVETAAGERRAVLCSRSGRSNQTFYYLRVLPSQEEEAQGQDQGPTSPAEVSSPEGRGIVLPPEASRVVINGEGPANDLEW